MLKLLITAATEKELSAIPREMPTGIKADFVVTGIGPALTSYLLTKQIKENSYDFAINTGIAGSFSTNFPVGSVAHIITDEFADLGTPTPSGFSTVFEMGFGDKNKFPFSNGKLHNLDAQKSFPNINTASAITVSTITSTDEVAKKRYTKHNAELESMEGASFFLVCLSENIPCAQIRSISNYTGNRDKSRWDIEKALNSLTEVFPSVLKEISKPIYN